MEEIIKQVLREQIDFSIFPTGGPTAGALAVKIKAALNAAGYMDATGIPGHFLPTEHYRDMM